MIVLCAHTNVHDRMRFLGIEFEVKAFIRVHRISFSFSVLTREVPPPPLPLGVNSYRWTSRRTCWRTTWRVCGKCPPFGSSNRRGLTCQPSSGARTRTKKMLSRDSLLDKNAVASLPPLMLKWHFTKNSAARLLHAVGARVRAPCF